MNRAGLLALAACVAGVTAFAQPLGPITLVVQDDQGRAVEGAEVACVN